MRQLREIDFSEYIKVGNQQGTNPGGFFRHQTTGEEFYIKWLPENLLEEEKQFFKAEDLAKNKYQNRHRNRFVNEYLANKMYELYGVRVPNCEFITFTNNKGQRCYGIASRKQENLQSIRESRQRNQYQEVCANAQDDFLIDVLFSNYDVIGTDEDNLLYDPETLQPTRIDPGGALRYFARGGAKKERFNAAANEFEDMLSGQNTQTGFYHAAISSAGEAFTGILESPRLLISLKKMLGVSDAELSACIAENGFDSGEESDKGASKNQALTQQLLARKTTITNKALASIASHLIDNIQKQSEQRAYLQQAGLNSTEIDNIISALSNKPTNKEPVITAIRQAVDPGLKMQIRFDKALKNKDWDTVVAICEANSPFKPEAANTKTILEDLLKNAQSFNRYTDYYNLMQALHPLGSMLEEGPQLKSDATIQLEELFRRLLSEEGKEVEMTIQKNPKQRNRQIISFANGDEYDWSYICKNADFEHLQLTENDFANYVKWVNSDDPVAEIGSSSLEEERTAEYQAALYQEYTARGVPFPDPPISFAEMRAINIYTGGWYKNINPILRNQDLHFEETDECRSSIIVACLTASGLRKVPMVNIETCHRGTNLFDFQVKRYAAIAAQHGVVNLSGFVSTSVDEIPSKFRSYGVQMEFHNVVGAYVAPISHNPEENEFLMPPCQVQLTDYQDTGRYLKFTANVVRTLSSESQAANIANCIGMLKADEISVDDAVQILLRTKNLADNELSEHLVSEQVISAPLLSSQGLFSSSKYQSHQTKEPQIQSLLLKILLYDSKNDLEQKHQAIQQLFKLACKRQGVGRHLAEYATNTGSAKNIISAIQNDPKLQAAFDIEPGQIPSAIATQIAKMMQEAFSAENIQEKPQGPNNQNLG